MEIEPLRKHFPKLNSMEISKLRLFMEAYYQKRKKEEWFMLPSKKD